VSQFESIPSNTTPILDARASHHGKARKQSKQASEQAAGSKATYAVRIMVVNVVPPQRHISVVLFYKYFRVSEFPLLHRYPKYYERKLLEYQSELCARLGLKGRILVAVEGVNGTLSAPSPEFLKEYIRQVEDFELVRYCGVPASEENHDADDGEGGADVDNSSSNSNKRIEKIETAYSEHFLFRDIDWKESSKPSKEEDEGDGVLEPFPDLKIAIVKEIISSGNTVSIEDIERYGGRHLDPKEFHEVLLNRDNGSWSDSRKDVVLIDVRNTFEYEVGHFVDPSTHNVARNPEMTTFSSFDGYCMKHADELKDKKILMYW